jgi:DNA polymerase I
MQKKVFLLDAFALIFRAYYALIRNPRLTTTGKNTNAQFGFTNTILDLINNHQPTHMAVCFDTSAATERHTDFADYKANRQETPEDISLAVPDIKKIIEALNIPILAIDGYEADDVIGALAKQAEKEGFEVFMVTPDKDYGQLVSDNIKILKPPYQGNGFEVLGPKEVCEKWDIAHVNQVIDVLGLMGDAVDNIPGIPGVGEKTAAKLLKEYGTLENVLDNAANIKGKLGEKVAAGKESALLSKKLATIITNIPAAQFNETNFKIDSPNKDLLREIFTELEFKTLGKRLLGEDIAVATAGSNASPAAATTEAVQMDLFGNIINAPTPAAATPEVEEVIIADKNIFNTPHNYHLVNTPQAIQALINNLLLQVEICFDTETTNIDANLAQLVGMSFATKSSEAYYVPCPQNQTECAALLQNFAPLFASPNILWIGQNIKYDLLVLKWYGYTLAGKIFDTMLAHYVLEPEGKRSMDVLAEKYLGYVPVSIETLIGKKGKNQGTMADVPLDKITEYAAEDADITLQLKHKFLPQLTTQKVDTIFYEVENPLVPVLTNMEFEGVRIDEQFLNEYSKTLDVEAKQAEEAVYQAAGVRFNLASPKQLGEVLFDKLQLDPKAKKTKTGQYATGEDVLLKLAKNKIVDDILAFREYTKLKSTYVDALPQLINPKTGRVHTSYAQAVAVTGRLSSNNPNLQNIPIRTAKGKEIRKAFIPRSQNHTIISADYSQIELRIVAAISGDPAMCQAFTNNQDIHTATAAKVFNVPLADVTKEMRYKAKSVNFGIIYGQGAFGLAENLGISRAEAKEIIDNYKKEFSSIQKYMDDTINFAKENGFVQTLMGRKRWLKDITSQNFTVRGFAERNAINSPIQGTAADMVKLAMIKIHHTFAQHNFKSKMILQVHDELVFDAHNDELETIKPIILHCMQTAMQLPNGVPVLAEMGMGKNWLEAH